MKSKICGWACAATVATIGTLSLIGALLLIRALSSVLWSQEAAGWVQAIGSIAAIYGAYALAMHQHRQDNLAEALRHSHDEKRVADAELASRTLAVRNLVQVAFAGLDSAQRLIAHADSGAADWEREKHLAHSTLTRSVLDAMITPQTEHLALITALDVSRTLSQVSNDIQHIGGSKRVEILLGLTDNVNKSWAMVLRLTNIQSQMLDLCRERGIPVEINDFHLP